MDAQKTSGKITAFSIKGDGEGKSYRMMIRGSWYSVFANRIKDETTLEIMNGLKTGDEVEIEYVVNKGFNNIVGLTRIDRARPEPEPAQVQPAPAQPRAAESRDKMMIASYAKDMTIHFVSETAGVGDAIAAFDVFYEHLTSKLLGE